MKLGQHQGKRAVASAKIVNSKDRVGYVFESIKGSRWVKNRFLFVFDQPNNATHDANSYFSEHEDEWSQRLEKRCFWINELPTPSLSLVS